jgi:quercetin dioxygenase-like cupin family protein
MISKKARPFLTHGKPNPCNISVMSDPISCDNLDEAIDHYTTNLGYRLDMIVPADSPREALLTKDGETIRLVVSSGFSWPEPPEGGTQNTWIAGRAGMEYRDLIPGRLNGRLIASHIRLTKGGEVPDYVHYHKVEFQMIYCKRGRIRGVYEDQGEPFWLKTGDCVLQPPEIRHRVLECTAGAEVIELGVPAVHETWVEHDIALPTTGVNRDRIFGGQIFCLDRASEAEWDTNPVDDLEMRETSIGEATRDFAIVKLFRLPLSKPETRMKTGTVGPIIRFYFVLRGNLVYMDSSQRPRELKEGDSLVTEPDTVYSLTFSPDTEILDVGVA